MLPMVGRASTAPIEQARVITAAVVACDLRLPA